MESVYVGLLVITFLAIGAMAVYVLAKLFAGQR